QCLEALIFCLFEIVNVDRGSQPALRSILHFHQTRPAQVPAIRAIGAAQPVLGSVETPGATLIGLCHEVIEIVGMDDPRPDACLRLFKRQTGVSDPVAVDVEDLVARRCNPDHLGDGFRKKAVALLALPKGTFGFSTLGYIENNTNAASDLLLLVEERLRKTEFGTDRTVGAHDFEFGVTNLAAFTRGYLHGLLRAGQIHAIAADTKR